MNGSAEYANSVKAGGALGLTAPQRNRLFMAAPLGHKPEYPYDVIDPTPKQAAKVLRHLAITGEVNWEIAKEQP